MMRPTPVSTVVAAIVVAALTFLFLGCESSDGIANAYWEDQNKGSASNSSSQSSSSGSSSASSSSSSSSSSASSSSSGSSSSTSTAGAADAVPYGSLRWTYGGVNGGAASKTSASIGGLGMSKNNLSYRWTGATLSSWGLSNSAIGAYACLFVQKSDGSWVGGKFDWISTSRTSRSFENIYGGYEGWKLSGVPNPCQAAFVIISADCKKRTNVISAKWSR